MVFGSEGLSQQVLGCPVGVNNTLSHYTQNEFAVMKTSASTRRHLTGGHYSFLGWRTVLDIQERIIAITNFLMSLVEMNIFL